MVFISVHSAFLISTHPPYWLELLILFDNDRVVNIVTEYYNLCVFSAVTTVVVVRVAEHNLNFVGVSSDRSSV